MGPCTSSMKLIMVLQQIRNLPSIATLVVPFSLVLPSAFLATSFIAITSCSASKHFASCFSPSWAVGLKVHTVRTKVVVDHLAFAAFELLKHLQYSCPFCILRVVYLNYKAR